MKRPVAGGDAAAGAALSGPAAFADPGFSATVIGWQKAHGRHTLPWQQTRDPYRVWLSEIMLQQTQVAAVIPYYQRFLQRFPDVASLAAAPSDEVMSHWSGLGYYSRARNLHACAKRIVSEHGGVFPADPEELAELPGIGRSTAAAIAAFSYGVRAAILDGNVKRVFARVFGIDRYPGERQTEALLWQRAVALLPSDDMESYTQGLMDLGATICVRSRPHCGRCPLASRCVALASGRTAELPVRKPKSARPEKTAVMMVITHGGDVLLEQRPDRGIWGGLLSLPELPGAAMTDTAEQGMTPPSELARAAAGDAARFGSNLSTELLQPFEHVFTHFKLKVQPVRICLATRVEMDVAKADDAPRYLWVPSASLASAPLPAPVKKLLRQLLEQRDLLAGI